MQCDVSRRQSRRTSKKKDQMSSRVTLICIRPYQVSAREDLFEEKAYQHFSSMCSILEVLTFYADATGLWLGFRMGVCTWMSKCPQLWRLLVRLQTESRFDLGSSVTRVSNQKEKHTCTDWSNTVILLESTTHIRNNADSVPPILYPSDIRI